MQDEKTHDSTDPCLSPHVRGMGSPIQSMIVHLKSSAVHDLLSANINLMNLSVVRTTMDLKSLSSIVTLVDARLTIKNHIDNSQCETGKSLDAERRK